MQLDHYPASPVLLRQWQQRFLRFRKWMWRQLLQFHYLDLTYPVLLWKRLLKAHHPSDPSRFTLSGSQLWGHPSGWPSALSHRTITIVLSLFADGMPRTPGQSHKSYPPRWPDHPLSGLCFHIPFDVLTALILFFFLFHNKSISYCLQSIPGNDTRQIIM